MSAPKIAGARRVADRYGAGVYRFPNNRGLSVAEHHDPASATPVAGKWDAVEVEFDGPGSEDFAVRAPFRFGLTDDELADMSEWIRGKDPA